MSPHRPSSLRLRGYNYSTPGAYFVTFGTHRRQPLLARWAPTGATLNPAGRMVESTLSDLDRRWPHLTIDAWAILPDHIHVLLQITREGGVDLSRIVQTLKSIAVVEYSKGVQKQHWPRYRERLWQRGFHDRIIRTQEEFWIVERYIRENPERHAIKRRERSERMPVDGQTQGQPLRPPDSQPR